MKSEKQLYQWDVNQYLIELQPTAEFVDYPMGNEVIRIEVDGTRCRIPDEVLQTYGGKTCYERYPDGTFRAYSFTVLYAPKPPDYVFTPEERTTFEALTARVDAAIEEIKRRADSGEFTPKKGVDYFTDAEKDELMQSVSTGAIGEFREVVDSATTEYNANASEKLTTYDTNAEQRTSDYNRNAEQKLEAYNQNHTEKVAEYNENAAALQTEVDRLRGECDQLAAENRKQENRIDALIKLNKGQTYDILPEEGESASRTAPSGAKYVSVDRLGGKSIVWNQLNNPADNINVKKGAILLNDDGSITISGTVQDAGKYNELQISQSLVFLKNQKYLVKTNKILSICVNGHDKSTTDALLFARASDWTGFVALGVANGDEVNIEELVVQVYNLTQMFGAGNEPTIEQFKKLFVQKIYLYNPGEIISSRTETITAGAEAITTGFPVLKSAGSVYDYIDLNEGKLHQRVGVVDLGTLDWRVVSNTYMESLTAPQGIKSVAGIETANVACPLYQPIALQPMGPGDNKRLAVKTDGKIFVRDSAYTDATAFKQAMSGVMLYYELAEEIITDITIPTELTEWLPVEAGGTVAFRNADESKQLAVPNAVSWVRKLNEVE